MQRSELYPVHFEPVTEKCLLQRKENSVGILQDILGKQDLRGLRFKDLIAPFFELLRHFGVNYPRVELCDVNVGCRRRDELDGDGLFPCLSQVLPELVAGNKTKKDSSEELSFEI